MVYKVPRAIDINAKSRLIRDKKKLLVIGRCIELEHPDILESFIEKGYAVLSICPEEEHVNHVGFKIAGILARNKFKEVTVLTVDGSMHCTQLHWMIGEIYKIMGLDDVASRKHYVVYKGKLYEIPLRAVKYSRYLYKIARLLEEGEGVC